MRLIAIIKTPQNNSEFCWRKSILILVCGWRKSQNWIWMKKRVRTHTQITIDQLSRSMDVVFLFEVLAVLCVIRLWFHVFCFIHSKTTLSSSFFLAVRAIVYACSFLRWFVRWDRTFCVWEKERRTLLFLSISVFY